MELELDAMETCKFIFEGGGRKYVRYKPKCLKTFEERKVSLSGLSCVSPLPKNHFLAFPQKNLFVAFFVFHFHLAIISLY